MFSYDYPTNLLKTYGPLTIFRDLAFKDLASCRAIRVFPVPGGPYKRIPLTCLIPYFYMIVWGNLLEAKALLKRLVSWLSSPPIPKDSIEKLTLKIFFLILFVDFNLICCSGAA